MTAAHLEAQLQRELGHLNFKHIAVAVSGGSDSMALLVLGIEFAAKAGVSLSAVTVDHGLRPEATSEAEMVADFCVNRGISHDILKWDWAQALGNVQAAARNARYDLISSWASQRAVECVCLAHTQDDQAETFLMRLARKAGSDGLRSMATRFERHGVQYARPLLSARRADLQTYLRQHGVAWVDDPSNEDLRYDRVKARKALLALAPLGIGPQELAAVSANLAEENTALRKATVLGFEGLVREQYGALAIDTEAYAQVEPVFARRFLASAVRWLTDAPYPPRSGALLAMHRALRAGEAHTLGGVIVVHSKGEIWLAREWQRGADPRWAITPEQTGDEIRALGVEGLAQLKDWRAFGLPRRAILPLPGVWRGDKLLSSPLQHPEKRDNTPFLRPSFNKWLSDH